VGNPQGATLLRANAHGEAHGEAAATDSRMHLAVMARASALVHGWCAWTGGRLYIHLGET